MINQQSLSAQQQTTIDNQIAAAMQQSHIPGLGLGIAINGVQVYSQGYGYADVENQQAVSAHTPFELGSVTKSYTTIGILALSDQGLIDLDSPLSSYLTGQPDSWQSTDIYRFLSMTSGLNDYFSNTLSWQDILQAVGQQPLHCAAGSCYNYSNPSFMLMGELAQTMTGIDFLNFITNTVLSPLGLNETIFNDGSNEPDGLAIGYDWNGTSYTPAAIHSPLSGFSAGAMISTGYDLAEYGAALQNRALLQANTYTRMWSDVQLTDSSYCQWGLGWGVNKQDQQFTVYKDGGLPGYSALVKMDVNNNAFVGVTCNTRNAKAVAGIVDAILGVIIG